MFAMLDELARTLEGDSAIAGSEAAFQAEIGAAIMNIDQGSNAWSACARKSARGCGHRHRGGFRDSEEVDLQELISDMRDVDYAQAISQLNQQYTGLQAAQAAYSKFAQLSLFDYL